MRTGTYYPSGLVCRVASATLHRISSPTVVPNLSLPAGARRQVPGPRGHLPLFSPYHCRLHGWRGSRITSFLRHLYPALDVSSPSAKRNETSILRPGHRRRRPRWSNSRTRQMLDCAINTGRSPCRWPAGRSHLRQVFGVLRSMSWLSIIDMGWRTERGHKIRAPQPCAVLDQIFAQERCESHRIPGRRLRDKHIPCSNIQQRQQHGEAVRSYQQLPAAPYRPQLAFLGPKMRLLLVCILVSSTTCPHRLSRFPHVPPSQSAACFLGTPCHSSSYLTCKALCPAPQCTLASTCVCF